jgi:UDP-N-acetylglucosamine--N-acetylmuramyl-(pentapeptide) pyrophosphoryl-undecaprenol N-acetylglucosamine transferase
VRVVIATGGTGGHVFPALALADRLVRDHGAEVRFVGTRTGQEATRVPAAGYRFDAVDALPFVREVSWRAAKAPIVALRSARACGPLVRGADVAVGMGGYASVPAMLAARRARVPIVLHEANAVPGLATRLLARFASAIAIAFRDVRRLLPDRSRVELIGYPIRDAIREVPRRRAALAEACRSALDLDPERRTVLVWGGSQGARHLDEVVAGAVPAIQDRADVQLLVLTGPANEAIVADAASATAAVRILPFLERIELAYAAADLAVSRAGATAIAEQSVCALPTILVPYPHATENHQEANARELERAGDAEVVLDAALTSEVFVERVDALLDDQERRSSMAAQAAAWARPDAAERFGSLVAEVAKG